MPEFFKIVKSLVSLGVVVTLLTVNSFMKAFIKPFEAPQRSVKIKI